jgi:hypothetical protein
MRNVIGVLLIAPLLLLLVWCFIAMTVEICKQILEESGIKELIICLSIVLAVIGVMVLATGCTQKHYKGVIMDGNCEYQEVPGSTPIVVCPDGRGQ